MDPNWDPANRRDLSNPVEDPDLKPDPRPNTAKDPDADLPEVDRRRKKLPAPSDGVVRAKLASVNGTWDQVWDGERWTNPPDPHRPGGLTRGLTAGRGDAHGKVR